MSNAQWISMEHKREKSRHGCRRRKSVPTALVPSGKRHCDGCPIPQEDAVIVIIRHLDYEDHSLYNFICSKTEINSYGSLFEVGQLLVSDTSHGPVHSLILSIAETLKTAIKEASVYLSQICPGKYNVDKNGCIVMEPISSENDPFSPDGVSVIPPD